MAGRRLVTYRDPDTAYTRPATNVPGSAGWARTIGHDIAMLRNATAPQLTTVAFTPTWTDTTVDTTTVGKYLRVGQMCYVWAYATLTAIGTAGTGLSLPVDPADTVLPMVAGHGHLHDSSASTAYPFVVVVEDGAALFYWADSATDGKVINADPVTVASGDSFAAYVAYRVGEPPAGRLNGSTYRLDEEYP